MIPKITHNSKLLALIISHTFNEPGAHCFTEDGLSQQLAYMRHPKGKIIKPHVHNQIKNARTHQETLEIY